jgi:hypothetical protein
MATKQPVHPLVNSDFQYVLAFFAGMVAFWVSSWVSSLIPAKYFLPDVDVLNLVTLVITLSLYVGFMVLFSRLMRIAGTVLTVATTILAALVSGLFAYVFLATLGQIYNSGTLTAGDAAVVELAICGIFGIFYAIGWWCGQHYTLVTTAKPARARRARKG